MQFRVINLLRVALGIGAGLALAEGAFFLRDHGAFPRLNVYEADDVLGVRLRPGARERVSFNSNPVTDVRINPLGFRGPIADPPRDGEILVVGDSQVFGLGVEETEAFPQRIQEGFAGRSVFNAGVPTYGPPEFYEITKRELEARRAHTVVYVVNMANDLFEAARPNPTRHVVVDGWALRRESAPGGVREFPGRELLFRDSHAVFALRTWLRHEPGDPSVRSSEADVGFASEGTWRDLLGQVQTSAAAKGDATTAKGELDAVLAEQLRKESEGQAAMEATAQAESAFRARQADIDRVMSSPEGQEYARTHGNPGDLTETFDLPSLAEAARRPRETVTRIVAGAEIKKRIETVLAARTAELQAIEAAKLKAASRDDRAAITARIDALSAKLKTLTQRLSPLREPLRLESELCKSHGARLVVLVLPLDVQVSSSEWRKYGESERDMSSTVSLIDDIRSVGADLGVPVWSALDTLRAAEPGAFLNGDIHMTPKGHDAVARAFSAYLHGLEDATAASATGR